MLEIIASGRSVFPSASHFAADAISEQAARGLVGPVLGRGWSRVRGHLVQFADLVLPSPCDWPVYVLSEDWNWRHLVLCGPGQFISYRWSTSA